MLCDIRKYNEPVKFSYMLMKPDGWVYDESTNKYHEIYEELGYMQYLTANIDFNLSMCDELTISIPKWVTARQKTVTNPLWDKIYGGYVIEVTNNISDSRQRFLIKTIEKNVDAKFKINITAQSLESEYDSKSIKHFSSKTLDGNSKDIDEVWYLSDILNHLNSKYMDDTWSIGHIDSNVAVKQRSFDVSNVTAYSFLQSLQETFCCIFKFNSVDRIIDVCDVTIYPVCPNCHKREYLAYYGSTLECYNPDCYIDVTDKNMNLYGSDSTITVVDDNGNRRKVLAKDKEKVNWTTTIYGRDTGLYLSEKNYINVFKETQDIESLTTRLYVYGKDELTINTASLNYGGQPYLENFDYFRNDKFMTDDLLEALDRYDALYQTKSSVWNVLNDEYYSLLREYSSTVVISENEQSLLDELQLELKSITSLSQIQASGSSTEKLDTLKEIFKNYNDQIIHYLDEDETIKEDKIIDLLEKLSETITGIEGKVVDISKAIKAINDSFEYQFSLMEQALKNDINLEKYSLGQLEEALSVYEARVDVLNNISKNIISADVSSELTTGSVWEKGDYIYYRLVKEDTDTGTAETVFDNFKTPYILSNKTTDGYFEFNLPNKYTKAIRNNDIYSLELWVAKKQSDGKYADRVLQTENVHYYVVKTGSTSGSIYKIRQNNIDLTVIKIALEKAIEKKKAVVADIKARQDDNENKINDLKLSLNKSTATDDKGLIFTDVLIRELNRFIRESVYRNEDIGVADINSDINTDIYKKRVDELYQEGMTAFYTRMAPPIEFEIDVVNFLRDIRYQRDWNKISLGDMIHIGHCDALKKDYIVRIIKIVWNPTDNFLELTLSNDDTFQSAEGFVRSLVQDARKDSTTISVNKEKWNNSQSNAVDEILNTAWNEGLSKLNEKTDITLNDYSITTANALNSKRQTRLNGGMLIFTDDNWNTVKTSISNGQVMAEVLAGKIMFTKNLHAICQNSENGQMYFSFDEQGAKFHNTGISITSDGEGNGNGVEIGTGADEGIIVTRQDGLARIALNANDGLYCQKATTPFNWTEKNKTVKTGIDGTMVLGGDIHAKRLFLQEIGGSNILTYIDKKTDSYTNSSTYNPNADEVKLSGKYLEGRGFKAFDQTNNVRVEIDGNTGAMSIYNGYIEMEDDDGNALYIDPEDFLTWVINGKKKFYYDKSTNSLKFGGTIDTTEDMIVGQNATIGKDSTTGKILFGGMTPGTPTASIQGYENNGKILELEAENILLNVPISDGNVYIGDVNENNVVIKKSDLENFNTTIRNLTGRIQALENKFGV